MAGDPYWLPHPVRLIGSWIGWLTKKLLGNWGEESQNIRKEKRNGSLLVPLVVLPSVVIPLLILLAAYRLHPMAGVAAESIMTYQILATKCLKKESMKVYQQLEAHNLPEARKAVSMIVGRDTEYLDDAGVAKAAVETVAENTSDGVIAPMLCLAAGGPVLGFAYKAINTMDSMVGYKNDRYLHFGRTAAKLDDAVNYLPARVSALLMLLSAFLPGKDFSGKNAWRIFKRDRFNHASPNSAQTEAVCAGALRVRLAGPASYFGKQVEKPYIGDSQRPIEAQDIPRANRLLYRTAFLSQGICMFLLIVIYFLTQP